METEVTLSAETITVASAPDPEPPLKATEV